MKSSGGACSLLLLTMAAVCSGRNATEYFQQARFQHIPSRPEDALIFFTAAAPPLICELEMDGDWAGGDRLKADLILKLAYARSFYTCSFERNATSHADLKLILKRLTRVFVSEGERKLVYISSEVRCTTDSQLPEEYFHVRIQRPNEEGQVKCRFRSLDEKLYVRFPGYPTIICQAYYPNSPYRFKLLGIVGDWLECAFQVYSDLDTNDKHSEKQLHHSLVSGLPTRTDGRLSNVVCSRHSSLYGTGHFQVRLPGSTIYDCSFSNTTSHS
ncbi:uncharacterized protein LOC126418865 [Schistocerca serialis cubense]|uniref:uncharacterized protein LOC126418865 n=1 Tax=Schistocerca serialis cubense TaxID=2023355 RepID=UPI00214E67B8|nr:uncharacterized protein LOC126418865 [Schistocerca serialis cubense]